MGEEANRWRVKQERYPTYSFSLNRDTEFLQAWLEQHKAAKRLPAVVRMGLLLVRKLEEMGCQVPEDDPRKLDLFLGLLMEAPGVSSVARRVERPKIGAGENREETNPEKNLDDFLKEI